MCCLYFHVDAYGLRVTGTFCASPEQRQGQLRSRSWSLGPIIVQVDSNDTVRLCRSLSWWFSWWQDVLESAHPHLEAGAPKQ